MSKSIATTGHVVGVGQTLFSFLPGLITRVSSDDSSELTLSTLKQLLPFLFTMCYRVPAVGQGLPQVLHVDLSSASPQPTREVLFSPPFYK